MNKLEKSYSKALNASFGILNPIKKKIINTHCRVHKYINVQGIRILKNDKYTDEYNFFSNFIIPMNEGAVWADQDFKSNGHFYNPTKKKGIYGGKSAMDLAKEYYNKALKLWSLAKFDKSLFYLGASLHIIQDMTIPQHANIKLLDNHRQYETFVKRTYTYISEFQCDKGSYLLDSIDEYIRFNSRMALKIHKRFKSIKSDEERFYKVARCGLPIAQRTTAGCMILFYNTIFKKIS